MRLTVKTVAPQFAVDLICPDKFFYLRFFGMPSTKEILMRTQATSSPTKGNAVIKQHASFLAVALAIAALQSASYSASAVAQATAEDAKEAKGNETQLEKITVTAQRREQKLQSLPVPVSTFTARDLELRNITNT